MFDLSKFTDNKKLIEFGVFFTLFLGFLKSLNFYEKKYFGDENTFKVRE
jgi:hypothetical protein